ncbi:MAG TPA: hypothetical protein VGZ73_28200 [Bryobacteraceae bacterium]|jgi:hypothetical protein|nr:hypothetical protein [Bryobacteraceae bacterium]
MATDELSFKTLSAARDREKSVPLTLVTGPDGFKAVAYRCILNEDNDGAPTCYGPEDIIPSAIEPLRYATNHANWVFSATNHNFEWHAVVNRTKPQADAEAAAHKPPRWKIDPNPALQDRFQRFPVVKQSGGARGYYVSTTSLLAHPGREEWEQERYFNAVDDPYAALTPPLVRQSVSLGDYGLAVRAESGTSQGFIFADSGNENKVGEVSRKLFRTFFPRANQEGNDVIFLVFPGSGAGLSGISGIKTALFRQMTKLSQASNADDLILRFAHPEIWDFLSTSEKLRDKDPDFGDRYRNILSALRDRGYRPRMGDFPVQRAPATA